MPANVTSPEVRSLMAEFPAMLGNLISPGAWHTPPGVYALDNGRFAASDAARDAAWSAASDAARDAAWSAASDAASNAAWSAAWSAASDAASNAAWSAAWDAARDAAWDEYNAELERMLTELLSRARR